MGTGRSMRGSAPRPGGGNNSPRAPLIPPCGFAAAAGQGERDDCAQKEGPKGKAGRRGVEALGPRAT